MFGNYRSQDTVEPNDSTSSSESSGESEDNLNPSNIDTPLTEQFDNLSVVMDPQEVLKLFVAQNENIKAITETCQSLLAAQQQNKEEMNKISEAVCTGIGTALSKAQYTIQQNVTHTPNLTPNTFPSLILGKNEDNILKFATWKHQVELLIFANKSYKSLDDQVIIGAILASFKGPSQELTLGLQPTDFESLGAFFDSIESSFCSGAVSERAFVSFSQSYQGPLEDATNFANRCEASFNNAFPKAENRSFQVLAKQFLAGLRDQDIADKIFDREGGVPDKFSELRDLVVKLTAKKDQKAQNRLISTTLKKHGHVPSGIGNSAFTPKQNSSKPSGVEPMDINFVGAGRGRGQGYPSMHNVPQQMNFQARALPPPQRPPRFPNSDFQGVPVGRSTGFGPPPHANLGAVPKSSYRTARPPPPPEVPNLSSTIQRGPTAQNPAIRPQGPPKTIQCFICKGPHHVNLCPKNTNQKPYYNKAINMIDETVLEPADDDLNDFPPDNSINMITLQQKDLN